MYDWVGKLVRVGSWFVWEVGSCGEGLKVGKIYTNQLIIVKKIL
ncbi:MAG: hypothetical protein SWX82_05410 [Cyanobacteriota bacterium]|nr:hypothetical protein [Cyanobacteriota bacterium]